MNTQMKKKSLIKKAEICITVNPERGHAQKIGCKMESVFKRNGTCLPAEEKKCRQSGDQNRLQEVHQHEDAHFKPLY